MCEFMPERHPDDNAAIYLVGGGIASLAAAAFLIRDGDIPGQEHYHPGRIAEDRRKPGRCRKSPEMGTSCVAAECSRASTLCTFDLFSSIPTLDESKTVTQEIFDWNETMKTSSQVPSIPGWSQSLMLPNSACRSGISLTLEQLSSSRKRCWDEAASADQFDPSFFETDFWIMWCTTFAFQPGIVPLEFKRYLYASHI